MVLLLGYIHVFPQMYLGLREIPQLKDPQGLVLQYITIRFLVVGLTWHWHPYLVDRLICPDKVDP